MIYEPTNWQTGDVVSSERLNKLESGLANEADFEVQLVPYSGDSEHPDALRFNKTAGEIFDAIEAGKRVIYTLHKDDGSWAYGPMMGAHALSEDWTPDPWYTARYVFFTKVGNGYPFRCNNLTDYPIEGYNDEGYIDN